MNQGDRFIPVQDNDGQWFGHSGKLYYHDHDLSDDSTFVCEFVDGQFRLVLRFDYSTNAYLPDGTQVGRLELLDDTWTFRHLDESTTKCCVDGRKGLRQSEIMIAKLVIDGKIKTTTG